MNPSHIGGALVTLQFGILAWLGWLTLPRWQQGDWNAGSTVLWLAGLLLGLWAVASNRPGNFNIRPAPKAGGRLVQHGPYRWVRHPMYSALLLLAAGCALATLSAWGLWLALLAVLRIKAALEEAWMTRAHPDYAGYRARTRRFLPWLL